MGYRYETHLHTCEVSACGRTKAKDYIKFYMEKGYAGIIFTDHFFNGNCGVDYRLPWDRKVDKFCVGYELAKEEGDKTGFPVFFGWEFNFQGDEYLTYGLDKKWLKEHPEIMRDTREEYYKKVHEAGGIVIQAHPYRERDYLNTIRLNPYYVDAAEIINMGNELYQDVLAEKYAEIYHLPVIGGSDMHNIDFTKETSGVETEQPISSIQDFVKFILSKKGFKPIVVENRLGVQKKKPSLPVLLYKQDGVWENLSSSSKKTPTS